jgi:hypothetical protein
LGVKLYTIRREEVSETLHWGFLSSGNNRDNDRAMVEGGFAALESSYQLKPESVKRANLRLSSPPNNHGSFG